MGEIADMIIDGFLDSVTGEIIDGDSPGFPRTKTKSKKKKLKSQVDSILVKCPKCPKFVKGKRALMQHMSHKHK